MCFLRLDSFRLKATAVNFETNGRDARATIFCRQDELSYEEIAKILDCSLSATKSLIHRGRETLKEKLKPYLKSGSWED